MDGVRTEQRGRRPRALAACAGTAAAAAAIAMAAPGAAHAQAPVGHIDGSPLDVYADGLGNLQARFDGRANGEFYPPSSDPGNGRLEIVDAPPGQSFSSLLSPAAVSGPVLTRGGGTQTLHSVYTENGDAGPLYQVSEDVTYANGASEFRVHYVIQNVQGGPATFRAGELADLYTGDSDDGTGIFDPTPPRFVGGKSPNGGTGGLREITPWSHYQESSYGDVFANFENSNTDPAFGPIGLNDTVDPNSVDYGAGGEWDFSGIAPGATVTIDAAWQFATGTITIDQLSAPVYGRSVNVLRSKGIVRIKVPGAKHYTKLTSGAQVPMGTLLDTKKGRLTLVSADKLGITQHAGFYQGIFQVKGQTKGRKPITLLNLAGPKPACGGKASIARKRRSSRRLWGSGKGRFRTKGQFSSATVRGTIWLTQDSCKGTLVKVKRGVVTVDDFTARKNFKVKAGHSHLAVPRRKHK
jgi:hypothetical protein